MICNVYIIHESGTCLISRNYGIAENTDSDLFSGFLVAISNFAKHIIGDEINEIRMERNTITYNIKDSIMIAFVNAGKGLSRKKMSLLFSKIFITFMEEYREYIQENIIEPSIFTRFSKDLDNILNTSGAI